MSQRIMAGSVMLLILGLSMIRLGHAQSPVSGYTFLGPEIQAMQDDEFANPGMSSVDKGRRFFHQTGNNGRNCASCHGDDGAQLNLSRIASYPIYSHELNTPITLQQQINICWEDQLDNVPFVYDCVDLLALETFVRNKAQGLKVMVDIEGPLRPYYEAGEQLYHTRFGQMDMACVQCHEVFQGRRLRGQRLSQGQSNGFPEYRLGSGKITSLHGRFQECFRAFRAEPFEPGSPEYINLEVYINARGNGLEIETPAIRY